MDGASVLIARPFPGPCRATPSLLSVCLPREPRRGAVHVPVVLPSALLWMVGVSAGSTGPALGRTVRGSGHCQQLLTRFPLPSEPCGLVFILDLGSKTMPRADSRATGSHGSHHAEISLCPRSP